MNSIPHHVMYVVRSMADLVVLPSLAYSVVYGAELASDLARWGSAVPVPNKAVEAVAAWRYRQ